MGLGFAESKAVLALVLNKNYNREYHRNIYGDGKVLKG